MGLKYALISWIFTLVLSALDATAYDCVVGYDFSIAQSANGWSQGVLSILDLFVGMPWMITKDLEKRLREERSR